MNARPTGARPVILAAQPLDAVPPDLTGGAVAIGNFDGVHRGHQALLARTMADARALSAKAVVLTFEPNPRSFFRPDEPVFRLTPPEARARLLTAIGIDGLVVVTFDATIASLSPGAFIETVLVGRLRARSLIVGEDFRFGAKRAGTTGDLVEAARSQGFEVDIVGPVLDAEGDRFASSGIRESLAAGEVQLANRSLGYRWFVTGTVVPGERRGRELGFPTANIRLPADCRLRHGIYAVTFTRPGGKILPAVASYGRRPQFDNGAPLLEVYVLDFAGDLYGERAVVTFHDWIRPEMKFPSVEDLVATIETDVETARAMLATERRWLGTGPGFGPPWLTGRLWSARGRFKTVPTIWPDFCRFLGIICASYGWRGGALRGDSLGHDVHSAISLAADCPLRAGAGARRLRHDLRHRSQSRRADREGPDRHAQLRRRQEFGADRL